jgi:hypothetical protein
MVWGVSTLFASVCTVGLYVLIFKEVGGATECKDQLPGLDWWNPLLLWVGSIFTVGFFAFFYYAWRKALRLYEKVPSTESQ